MSQLGNEKKTIRTDIREVEETDNATKLLVKVTSFGSPDKKDLGGDYFKKDCDFGDKRVKTVKAFYDHALNTETNPFSKKEMQLIGSATLKEVDDVGRWFEFEIEKSNAYHDAILALHEMKILGASTQAYFGGVDRAEDGGISRWWESEVTLTVTPMDQKTIGETFLILQDKSSDDDRLKSLIEDWKDVLYEEAKSVLIAETKAEELEVVADSEDVVVEPDEIESEMEDVTLSEVLDQEVLDILETVEPIVEVGQSEFVTKSDLKSLMEEVQKISGMISATADIWAELEEAGSLAAILSRITAQQEEMSKIALATQKAVKHLATHTAKVVSSEVKRTMVDRSAMSQVELEAEKILESSLSDSAQALDNGRKALRNKSAVFPEHAPGGD